MMKEMEVNSSGPKFWLLWALVTLAAWVAGQYIFSLRNIFLKSATPIPSMILILFFNGLALGSIVGVFQWLVLRLWRKDSGGWLLSTIIGHIVGLPVSFAIMVGWGWLIAQRAGVPLFIDETKASLLMPLAPMMILAGVVVALAQWITLQRLFPSSKLREAVLWVAGTALGWGASFWAAAYIFAVGLSLTVQNAVAGGVVGVVTGAILVLLLSQPPAQLEVREVHNLPQS
jgi:hypothetical protein